MLLNLAEVWLTFPSGPLSSYSTPSAALSPGASPLELTLEFGCCTEDEKTGSPALSPSPHVQTQCHPVAVQKSSWRVAGWRHLRAGEAWCCQGCMSRDAPIFVPFSAASAGGWSRGQLRRRLRVWKLRRSGLSSSSSCWEENRNVQTMCGSSEQEASLVGFLVSLAQAARQSQEESSWSFFLFFVFQSFQPHFSSSSFLGSKWRESWVREWACLYVCECVCVLERASGRETESAQERGEEHVCVPCGCVLEGMYGTQTYTGKKSWRKGEKDANDLQVFPINSWDMPHHPFFQKRCGAAILTSLFSPLPPSVPPCYSYLSLPPVSTLVCSLAAGQNSQLCSPPSFSLHTWIPHPLPPSQTRARENFTWCKQHLLFFRIHLLFPHETKNRDLLTRQRYHRAFPRVHLRCRYCGILKHLSSVWVWVCVLMCASREGESENSPAHFYSLKRKQADSEVCVGEL